MEPLITIGDVAATSLVTLYCHAIETKSKDPILNDPKSLEITARLDPILSRSANLLERTLAESKLDPKLVVHIAIRAKKYDRYVTDFLERFPDGVVVNIGCGLDSRFLRTDNGRVRYYDLDLPEVIDLKKHFFEETERYSMISSSVLDHGWMSLVSSHKGPFMFMAEGVFMYLDGEEVKSLVLALRKEFPGSELVCEVVNSFWLREPMKKILEQKMRRHLHIGKDAIFRSGISNSREMEEWHEGIRLIDDWSYFDSDEKKLGWLKIFSRIGFFRYTQWTVHYRLG